MLEPKIIIYPLTIKWNLSLWILDYKKVQKFGNFRANLVEFRVQRSNFLYTTTVFQLGLLRLHDHLSCYL